MAMTVHELYRKRRCQLGFFRTTFIIVFFVWFICIFYEIYEIRKTESEELGLLHRHTINSKFKYQNDKALQKMTNNANLKLETPSNTHAPPVHHGKISSFILRKNKNSGLFRNNSNVDEKKVQINHPPLIRKHSERQTALGKDRDVGKKVVRSNETYVEFDWQILQGRGTKRKNVVPGGRWDKPRLGERGKPVVIDPSKLEPAEKTEYNKDWDAHKFNEYVSKRISLQRDVPDNRDRDCKRRFDRDSNDHDLPKVSVIICFYNEAWTVLQRTIYSVLLRSPSHLVHEIVLVDDHSNLDSLKGQLEKLVAETDKLRLLRMTNRSGLVKARLAGINAAHGPVLVFLDSHVECQEGWLEPLVRTIVKNPQMAVTPVIDVISEKTFEITKASGNIGTLLFNSFSFTWGPVLPRIGKTLTSDADVIQSPTMAGGLFAIRKDFFLALGTYDPNLVLWGGENIELSLKLWLCGGGILIHPCSRVSHIFRDTSPYLTGKLLSVGDRNSARVAYVWADEYKQLYFKDKHFSPEEWKSITTDIQERIDLRKRLGCKPFRWYLENVYPEMHIEGTGKFMGPIMSPMNNLCIGEDYEDEEGRLILIDCDMAFTWEMTRIKEIRFQQQCMDVVPETNELLNTECDFQEQSQVFEYNSQEQTIYHPDTNRCLTVGPDGRGVFNMPCRRYTPEQKWSWSTNNGHLI